MVTNLTVNIGGIDEGLIDLTDIRWLNLERQEAASRASAVKEELWQAVVIAFGKPYLLKCVSGRRAFPGLTQVWRMLGAFSDLPGSVEEACMYYNANPDSANEQQNMFWLKFQDPACPQVLGDKLK